MSIVSLLFPTVLLLSIFPLNEGQGHSYDKSSKIRRLLMSRNIDPISIPIPLNGRQPFEVKAHFLLQNLINADTFEETMRLTASIALVWEDYNLRWTTNDSTIIWIFMPAGHVWYPQLLLSNSAGFQAYARPDPRFDNLWIYSNGTVILRMYYTFDINCEAEVFKFPRDRMVCKLALLSSSTSDIMVVVADTSSNDQMIAFKNDDREWYISDVTFKSGVETLETLNGSFAFSSVNAEIYVIRTVGYYLVVAQFPILMMSSLIVLSSFISVADGERLGFITELCLTYIVFLLLLDSILPKSSLPLLSVCVIICFCLSVINVIEAVVIRELLALSKRQGRQDEEGENCDIVPLVHLQRKDGKRVENLEVRRKGKRRPWMLYAERLDQAMLVINVIVVIVIIILNIGVVYS